MQEDLAAEPIPRGKDASMHLHLPASEYSQDTSHVFTSIFKDTYTKEVIGRDTASNLSKTKRGSSDHHEKHVEELEQIHSKNAECTKQADMLEKHITQARVRVAATEAQTRARLLEEMGEAYDQLGLPPARSTFQWCVDSDLLKRNNLIGPQDYRPDSRAERESYAARSAARDQTGGKPRDGSECSLQTLDGTLPRSDVVVKRKSSHVGAKCRPSVPKAASKSSDQSVAAARDSFKKLKAPQNVPRNPRFLPPHVNSLVRAPRGSKGEKKKSLREATTLSLLSTTDESVSVFQATPQVVSFTEYTVGQVYETSLELKNLTASSRYIRVIPPTTTYFSIGLGRFPGEGGMVAPGMCCKYTVRFAPDSLGDFEDYVVVETEAPQPLLVPLVARRPPPILSLPRVLDCGPSLVGGVKLVEYLCCNQGLSGGSFCIMPRSQWPASNLRTVSYSQDFTVVCDNCQVKDITIQERDLAAEHFVRFPSCHPHCVERKTAVIKNHTDLELPFFWQVMMPNLQSLLPGEEPDLARIHFHPATDDVFHVSPLIGSLAPRQDQAFEFTYLPKELKDHHSVCQLVVRDVPQCPTESGQSGAPKMSHVIVMEVEVKGSTKPYQLRLEPSAVVLPGKPFVGTTTRTKFKLWNHSTSGVLFHWERMNDCHIMEVEPCRGEIEVNACAQLDLVVTGGRPEKVVTSLLCHIEKHHQPLGLPVEVSFKGPELTLSDPILDLGLQRLGEESHRTVLLTNTSPLEASWTLGKSGSGGPEDPQLVSLEPRRGVLAAQASCRLDVVFRALACGHFDALLEISVEQGSECYLSVRADVESPRVCLSSSELAFSEIYVGVPANGVVSLVNRSLLPAHFAWTSQLQGKQASLCSASFRPPSGTLDPHATVDVTVEYTSHTDVSGTSYIVVGGWSDAFFKVSLCHFGPMF
ncbi:hypothetical protein NHX12_021652 [Muraenolepis orangiensis]|uniref:Deleted in lung and esophageal cancer protein 1 n=1 Tax=Muraenolepis orangiensis TaxID=630683 RepID=A0A9Q0ISJ7_9TELE|nr:hypothetical protein NHX12_021652 [Muraenolepis orangiensis]